MTISSVSSSSVLPPTVNATRQDLGQLVSAIQSGNLNAAQSAYSALTQNQSGQPSGPFAQAIAQIGDALQSGDIGQAQQDLTSLQQQVQSAKGAHRGHHGHHAHGSDPSQSSSTTSTSSNDPATLVASTSLVDVTA